MKTGSACVRDMREATDGKNISTGKFTNNPW